MALPDFSTSPLATNGALFAVSAAVVWIGVTKLAQAADRLAVATGLGHATAGLVQLAGVGIDSLAVLLGYGGGLVLLYHLR